MSWQIHKNHELDTTSRERERERERVTKAREFLIQIQKVPFFNGAFLFMNL